ncbi:MAG: patatin-like phospholipase family protein [Myxococcales bacterium]|nr:patatin-like phospholipase family protein [Myxococcales bacterium]
MEISLVREAVRQPNLVDPTEEAIVRTAISLARLYKVRHQGRDVGVGAFLSPFREEVTRKLKPVLLDRPPKREALLPLVRALSERTARTRDELQKRFEHRLPKEAIDREIRNKALVMVSGGGGGTGYVYVGVMALLDEFGLKPALLVGTSIGAILSLFRSRMPRFDHTEMANIVRGLSWRKLFRIISTENRYGLPAALRLFLRAGIGRYFAPPTGAEGAAVKLKELPVPTIVTVSGIRRGMLPHPVEFYERLLNLSPRTLLEPAAVTRRVTAAFGALAEFFTHPEMMVKLHLGADEQTREFDALDAVGFSSALPGVIHYDVLRDDARMRGLLDELFEQRSVFRLVDGGLVDNLPAKAAWRAVHKGLIGTRNAFILALNGFAQKLVTPLWLPLQRLAELNVAPNRPYAHLVKDFRRTLSPLELVPSVETLSRAVELGREQLTPDLPFLTRMLAPLPRM